MSQPQWASMTMRATPDDAAADEPHTLDHLPCQVAEYAGHRAPFRGHAGASGMQEWHDRDVSKEDT